MTSKEALISLNERFGTGKYSWGFNIEKELKIINQDLDRLEKLKEENKALKSDNTALEIWNDAYSEDWNKVKKRNEKLEKTIEFLKNVLGLSLDKNKIMFWVVTKRKYDSNNYDYARITKEEYELLREVLEDVKD